MLGLVFNILVACLAQIIRVVEVCVYVGLCNKVPYDINGVLLLLSTLYFYRICVLSPHVVHKGI